MNKIDLKDILQENLADDNQDYLSILGDEKEMLNDHTDIPDTLPILPLRNTVLFPGVIIPINIGREKSLKLIRYVYKSSVPFGVIAQRDTNTEKSQAGRPIHDRYSSHRLEDTGNAGWNNDGYHTR